MRLITTDEGPARLSRFSSTQAVGRGTPRAAACLAVVSYPTATNAARISASFEACLAFASNRTGVPAIFLLLFRHGCLAQKHGLRFALTRVA